MFIRIAMAGLLTLLVGCAAKIPEPASSTNHPANAGALSTDLSTVGSILVPADEESVHEADPFPAATKPSGGETQGHMGHDAPAAEPTAATTTEPVATYICPMHADVTATEPGRCPKCKMKLVEKRPK